MDLFLDLTILLVTIAMMLAVGMNLDARSCRRVLERKRLFALMLLLQWLLPPLAACLVVAVPGISAAAAAALFLIAACPVGDISNYYALKGRASLSFTLGLNAVSCLLAPLGMAGAILLYRVLGHDSGWFAINPVTIGSRVFLLVALPAAAGLWLAARHPARAARWSAPLAKASGAGIVVILATLAAIHGRGLAAAVAGTLPALALFLLATLLLGHLAGRVAGWPRPEARAFTLCLPTRNLGVASAVAVSMLENPGQLPVFALFLILEVPLLLGVAGCFAGRGKE
jgi:bile acid:Na+ symporter, BASS family